VTKTGIGSQIWSGDYFGSRGALARAQRAYREGSKRISERVAWASALYSALTRVYPAAKRGDPTALARMAWCLQHLAPQVRWFMDPLPNLSADQCDVVSTILCRWSQIPFLGHRSHLARAEYLALRAVSGLAKIPAEHHTHALACLTLAKILDIRGDKKSAAHYFEMACILAPKVANANQQSRIWRKLASLAPANDARAFLDHADAVPGIGADVRVKNIETRRELGL